LILISPPSKVFRDDGVLIPETPTTAQIVSNVLAGPSGGDAGQDLAFDADAQFLGGRLQIVGPLKVHPIFGVAARRMAVSAAMERLPLTIAAVRFMNGWKSFSHRPEFEFVPVCRRTALAFVGVRKQAFTAFYVP